MANTKKIETYIDENITPKKAQALHNTLEALRADDSDAYLYHSAVLEVLNSKEQALREFLVWAEG
jgi:hypothetical protein